MNFCEHVISTGPLKTREWKNAGVSKMHGWKWREWTSRHQNAGGNRGSGNRGTRRQGVENAGETSMERQNSRYLTLLSSRALDQFAQVGYGSQ